MDQNVFIQTPQKDEGTHTGAFTAAFLNVALASVPNEVSDCCLQESRTQLVCSPGRLLVSDGFTESSRVQQQTESDHSEKVRRKAKIRTTFIMPLTQGQEQGGGDREVMEDEMYLT